MAELLVRAKSHWMDSFTQAQIDAMDEGQKLSYNARSQIGDIIVVRPDGWTWGKEECLPNFIVVKLPQIAYETVKIYEQTLMDNTIPDKPVMLKRRKYRVPENVVKNYVTLGKSVVSIDIALITNFRNAIITKVS